MLLSYAVLCYQTRSLQQPLDPRVAHLDLVLLDELLVIVLYIEIKILFPIKPHHLLNHFNRYPLRTRFAYSLVKQRTIPHLFILLSYPP